jgi:hypothetical protein
MPEKLNPLHAADQRMAQRARSHLRLVETVELPDFDAIEKDPIKRQELLTDIAGQLRDNAESINALDRYREIATSETVFAYPSNDGDDMFDLERQHLTQHVENDVTLWPVLLLEHEQQNYTSMFIDSRGRLFGLVSEQSKVLIRPRNPYIPREIPLGSITVPDALAAHQGVIDTIRILRRNKK